MDKPDPKHVEKAREMLRDWQPMYSIGSTSVELSNTGMLATAIASALQQAADDAREWQPIETLKENVPCLLSDGKYVVEGAAEPCDGGGVYYPTASGQAIDATAWMPLPAPPNALKSTEETK